MGILDNIFGNQQAGTWNVLPAVLTTWSNLLSNSGNQSQYELYKQQAQNYKETARENAELIKSKGEIALRNLQYKNKLERGRDVVTVAASGGNMSGSNLDVMVQKEKIRKMDETTLIANYSNQAMLEIVNGYKQAASTYGTLAAKATADKWGAWASIVKGVETYVGLTVRDAKIAKAVEESKKQTKQSYDINMKGLESIYVNKPLSNALSDATGSTYDTFDMYGESTISKAIRDYTTPSTSLNNTVKEDSIFKNSITSGIEKIYE